MRTEQLIRLLIISRAGRTDGDGRLIQERRGIDPAPHPKPVGGGGGGKAATACRQPFTCSGEQKLTFLMAKELTETTCDDSRLC